VTTPDTSTGQQRISAITSRAKSKAEAKARAAAPKWPAKGMPYCGIAPGDWRFDPEAVLDDTGHLPSDCPVRPLGYDGENYFLIDTLGQVFNTGTSAFGVERMQKLFAGHEDFLYWAWPSFGKGGSGKIAPVNGFKAEEARRDLYAACAARGPWNPTDQVRGRGAWLDDRGRLVLHCGETLFVDGAEEGTGELGEHFYVRRPKAIAPWGKEVPDDDNPAVEIFKALCTWNFVRRETDAMLQLGWIGVAFMGAALDWRPSIFLVGDAGSGKSELQKLLKTIMGRFMISTTNATSAGLYQIVGHDALPIGIDELEGEDGQDQAAQIIKMARDAASGSVRIRGGANHQGVEFQARSTFQFSAINPPPIPPASMSRLALLQLRPLENIAESKGKAPALKAPETVGPRLLRRVMDNWGTFPTLYEAYRDVLRDNGHDSRGQNTFGTFLAAAHLLLGDAGLEALGYHADKLEHWGIMLAADAAPEVSGKTPNWAKCIEEIMISQVDAWNKGERRTIGQIIDDVEDKERNLMSVPKANELLAIAGLKLLEPGRAFDGLTLCVPQSGKDINKLLADSSWGGKGNTGSWNFALTQAPDHIVGKDMPAKSGKGDLSARTNRVSVGGVQRRCLFISLADLKQWQEG
jgi:hypothetical protein